MKKFYANLCRSSRSKYIGKINKGKQVYGRFPTVKWENMLNIIIIIENTHIISIAFWHEDVHLRGLGADYLDVERLWRQIDLTAVRLVDRHRRHLAQNL